ncbi:MAG: nucleotidyltransferase family protein [Alphaproteobacteria bacterium]|nr:nucleotidyltransferase family protein [Alphaproteobacteria bacterium]
MSKPLYGPIDQAFILAAGRGQRMQPFTAHTPKPLVTVGGQSLLQRTLDQLAAAGVTRAVINTHHLAPKIEAFVDDYKHQSTNLKDIFISYEPALLDTGGGIYKALQHFNDRPFYVLSGDGLWSDRDTPLLQRLCESWNPQHMDILIALQPVARMTLTQGVGDYDLLPDGRAVRNIAQQGTHMFTSIRINHPRIFADSRTGAFSYLDLLDRAQGQGRLFALEHAGDWHHLSTLGDVKAVEAQWRD